MLCRVYVFIVQKYLCFKKNFNILKNYFGVILLFGILILFYFGIWYLELVFGNNGLAQFV